MYTSKRDVLFVGIETAVYERLTEGLSLADFRTDYISTLAGALELMALLPYDALLVGYPPAGMPFERFVDAVRKEDSSCRRAALVLLARSDAILEAEMHAGRGANRVVPEDVPASLLQEILPGLVNPAPRHPLRALTRLEVPSELGPNRLLCQTVNVSSTGMLVRLDEDFPVGMQVSFELLVPGDAKPIRGRAEVVRHTVPRREMFGGLALRFCSFRGRDADRFAEQLTTLAS